MNKIPVVFALDNNYIEQLASVIASVLKNASSNTYIEFNILHNDIPEINKNKIKKLNEINNNCKFKFIDMIDLIKN